MTTIFPFIKVPLLLLEHASYCYATFERMLIYHKSKVWLVVHKSVDLAAPHYFPPPGTLPAPVFPAHQCCLPISLYPLAVLHDYLRYFYQTLNIIIYQRKIIEERVKEIRTKYLHVLEFHFFVNVHDIWPYKFRDLM